MELFIPGPIAATLEFMVTLFIFVVGLANAYRRARDNRHNSGSVATEYGVVPALPRWSCAGTVGRIIFRR
jgi:hypothetical protein